MRHAGKSEIANRRWQIELNCDVIINLTAFQRTMVPSLTVVKREKFAKNKENTSKERLSFLPYKV